MDKCSGSGHAGLVVDMGDRSLLGVMRRTVEADVTVKQRWKGEWWEESMRTMDRPVNVWGTAQVASWWGQELGYRVPEHAPTPCTNVYASNAARTISPQRASKSLQQTNRRSLNSTHSKRKLDDQPGGRIGKWKPKIYLFYLMDLRYRT